MPTSPLNVTVTDITSEVSAVVKWDASSDFGDIIEYWIFNGSTLLKKTTGTGDTIVSLKAVTKYTIVVRAKRNEIANFSPKSPPGRIQYSGFKCH